VLDIRVSFGSFKLHSVISGVTCLGKSRKIPKINEILEVLELLAPFGSF
jgi:hypothetical protein